MSDKENAKQTAEELAIANTVVPEKRNLGENVVGSSVDGSDQDTGKVPKGPWGWLSDTPKPAVKSEPAQSTGDSGGDDQAGQATD